MTWKETKKNNVNKKGDYHETRHGKKLKKTMQTKTFRPSLTELMKEITKKKV